MGQDKHKPKLCFSVLTEEGFTEDGNIIMKNPIAGFYVSRLPFNVEFTLNFGLTDLKKGEVYTFTVKILDPNKNVIFDEKIDELSSDDLNILLGAGLKFKIEKSGIYEVQSIIDGNCFGSNFFEVRLKER